MNQDEGERKGSNEQHKFLKMGMTADNAELSKIIRNNCEPFYGETFVMDNFPEM